MKEQRAASLTSECVQTGTYVLNQARLSKAAKPSPELQFRGVQDCYLEVGRCQVFGNAADFPPDQRAEAGVSPIFRSHSLVDSRQDEGPWLETSSGPTLPTSSLPMRGPCLSLPRRSRVDHVGGISDASSCLVGESHPRGHGASMSLGIPCRGVSS